MELEDRVLFSAAPMAMAIAPHGAASGPGHVHALGLQAAMTDRHVVTDYVTGQGALPSQPETNVVLIDSQLTDSGQLIARRRAGQQDFCLQRPA